MSVRSGTALSGTVQRVDALQEWCTVRIGVPAADGGWVLASNF